MISPSDFYHAKILIVDDRLANVRLLEGTLRGAGYTSITATMQPQDVCELHRKNSYDLILLDLMMPGMDGFEVMEGLKAVDENGYLPVLVITAQPGHKLRALKAGAKDFISKPIDLAEVVTRVHNMLEVRLLHRQAREHSRVLQETVDRLMEAERLKKGFLSTVSHEFRTPLTSIRGGLGLLASGATGALSHDALRLVEIAERNAVRLMALINDILDLERLETGIIPLRCAPVTAESIVRRALESLPGVGRRGVVVKADEVSAMIWADADRILQVLVNLLSNAVKFSASDEVVTIGVALKDEWLEFRVTDLGRGVPAAQHLAIFERFHQVETSDAREKGGAGLGLAICKSIVEQHGGTIGVESTEGNGSTFWFRIRTARVPAPGAVTVRRASHAGRAPDPRPAPRARGLPGPQWAAPSITPNEPTMKVLIIDDDPDIRTVTRLSLSCVGGMDVIEAASGAEGVRKARKENPDVILLDMMMPAMGGVQTLALLRAQAATAMTPVIFLTADAAGSEVERLTTLGAAGVLLKPFSPDTLAADVRSLVSRRLNAGSVGRILPRRTTPHAS
ncbi:MAG: two-component hybrid sensor and regulator [Acidobacteria bacterium]|nr:two-component hybrid sensor and regulator [Acidobacteriota bacterium]